MKNLVRVSIGCVVLIIMCSADARALGVVGDIWTGNSWGQRFQQEAVREFDSMRIDYLYGSNFELPTVFENFSANNWFATQESHDWAGAAGSSLRALEFDVIFDGDVIPTGFTFATYLRGQHQEFFSAELEGGQNGNHWVTRNCEGDPPPPLNSVPEPTSLLVLGIALVSRVVHRKYSKSPIS